MKKVFKIWSTLVWILILAFIIWNILPLLSSRHVEDTFPTEVVSSDTTTNGANADIKVLSEWNFRSTEDITTSGSIKIVQTWDSHILRIEDLQTTNGPDLFVYLSEKKSLQDESDVKGSYRLAKLKWNSGNQNYEIPNDIDISQYHSVAIHCRAYNHSFGYAELSQP